MTNNYFLPYQMRWLNDTSKIKIWGNCFPFYKICICGGGERAQGVSEVLHMPFDFNDFERGSNCLLSVQT